MVHPTVQFLASATMISLSGVLAPGPMTAATLGAGARRRHAGAWIAIGHGIIEFPLMGLIMLGAGAVLRAKLFRVGVGLAGGTILLLLAVLTLLSFRRPIEQPIWSKTANPLWSGVLLTGGNPYFLFWWATAGLELATRAVELGLLALGLFAVLHWLCDLIWLETLSLASFSGARWLGTGTQRVVVLICSAVMGVFGIWFMFDACRAVRLMVQ